MKLIRTVTAEQSARIVMVMSTVERYLMSHDGRKPQVVRVSREFLLPFLTTDGGFCEGIVFVGVPLFLDERLKGVVCVA